MNAQSTNNLISRQQLLLSWLDSVEGLTPYRISPLAGDASFRRYFRLHIEKGTHVIMDAPPPHENCQAFVDIAKLLKRANLTVPELVATDVEQGFLLLSDFGDRQLLQELTPQTVDHYYEIALKNLMPLQTCHTTQLPKFDDHFMLLELERFETWYLQNYRSISLTPHQKELLHQTYQQLIQSAIEQPQVLIHRDYHSRNLMILDHYTLGIIDFQDAMCGPFTYDVVSLLRDCYIAWPRKKVLQWALYYLELAKQASIVSYLEPQQFIQWFDWMGLQRHLKVLGIFARLYLRDAKSGYLQDIPQVLRYILEVSQIYPQLTAFNQFMRGICEQP